MADQPAGSKVFISYSRKDKEFVRKLNDALDSNGINAWVDWEGIPLSSDWMAEITAAIEAADSFLFVISPDSLASTVCADELNLGLKYNKKLVPILYRDPEKGTTMHEKLAATNWVYLRQQDDFEGTIPKLIDAINTDLDWVRQHTRILQRAKEWEGKGNNASFLLQGADLQDAERWMTESTAQVSRQVVPLQAEYIQASRKEAGLRQRRLLIGVSLALVVSIVLAIMAAFQWQRANVNAVAAQNSAATAVANQHIAATAEVVAEDNAKEAQQKKLEAEQNAELAKKNENAAEAQRSAAQAQYLQEQAGELYGSILLAVDSWNRLESSQAEEILRRNITTLPLPVGQVSQADAIRNITVSPDGRLFVTPSADDTACVWELDGTKKYCVNHDGDVVDALFTRDGKTLITASQDQTVRFWDAATGQSVRDPLKVGATIYDIDVDSDGDWLAIAQGNGIANIYSFVSGRIYTYVEPLGRPQVYVVKFSPNGYWLAVGSSNGNVTLWSLSGSLTGPKQDGEVFAIAFSADTKWIVTGGEDSKSRAGLAYLGGQRYEMIHGDWVEDVAFGPDSSWFVSASDDNKLRVWDLSTGQEKLRMEHNDFIMKVIVSPDGQWIASTGYDKTVRVWSADSGSRMLQIPLSAIGTALAFTPDGTHLLVGDEDGNASTWDLTGLLTSRVAQIEFPELTRQVRFSPDGKLLVANTDSKNLIFFKDGNWITANTGADGRVAFVAPYLTRQLAFSSDSQWVLAAQATEDEDDRALLYNVAQDKTYALPHGGYVTAVAFSVDNQYAAVAGWDGRIALWTLGNPPEFYAYLQSSGDSPHIHSVSFHPNGKWLAAGMDDQVVIWDYVVQTQTTIVLEQDGEVSTAKFSGDGKWLVSSGSQNSITIWSVDGENFAAQYTIEDKQALDADFSLDNRLLAIGGADKYAYIYDLVSGQEMARIPHARQVTGVSFSADGTQLATVATKVLQIWNIQTLPIISRDTLIAIACERLTNASTIDWKVLFPVDDYSYICPDLHVGRP